MFPKQSPLNAAWMLNPPEEVEVILNYMILSAQTSIRGRSAADLRQRSLWLEKMAFKIQGES